MSDWNRFLDLPPEIWIHILRLATDVPDSMLYPAFSYKRDSSTARPALARKRYYSSLVSKLNLVLVCRQWYITVLPYLYEHISIAKSSTGRVLVGVLKDPPVIPEANDGKPLGWYVKRLDIVASCMPWDVMVQEVNGVPSVAGYSLAPTLCSLAPNLVTLITTSDGPANGFPLSNVIPSTLEYLYWINAFTILVPQWEEFLDNHPRLAYLDPPFLDSKDKKIPLYKENLKTQLAKTYPALREVIFHRDHQAELYATVFHPSAFPSLENITFNYRPSTDNLDTVLSVLGSNLTSIHFKSTTLVPWKFTADAFKIFQEHCPRLNEVLLTSHHIRRAEEEGEWTAGLEIPQITILGLHCNGSHYDDSVLEWAQVLPSLGTIRLFEEYDGVIFHRELARGSEEALKLLAGCGEKGIRLEDHTGNEFCMPSRASSVEDLLSQFRFI